MDSEQNIYSKWWIGAGLLMTRGTNMESDSDHPALMLVSSLALRCILLIKGEYCVFPTCPNQQQHRLAVLVCVCVYSSCRTQR